MGYYYAKARSLKDLNEEQQARYREIRSPENDDRHPELIRRYDEVKEYIGPLFNGETMSALEELVQDSVVTWILADEDPSKVQWSNPKDLIVPEPEPTEEERQRNREAWDAMVRRWEEREAREKLEYEEWEKKEYPVRHFFKKLFDRFRKTN